MFQEDRTTLTGLIPWNFIGGQKYKNKTSLQSILELVEKETGMKLTNVDLLSSRKYNNGDEHFYSATLTDEHVNTMNRPEGKLFNFFAPHELKKITLSEYAKSLLEHNSGNINFA